MVKIMTAQKSAQQNFSFWIAIQFVLLLSINDVYAQSSNSPISSASPTLSSSSRVSPSCDIPNDSCQLVETSTTRGSMSSRKEKKTPYSSVKVSHSSKRTTVSPKGNSGPIMFRTSSPSQYLSLSPSSTISKSPLTALKSTTPSPVSETILNSQTIISSYSSNITLQPSNSQKSNLRKSVSPSHYSHPSLSNTPSISDLKPSSQSTATISAIISSSFNLEVNRTSVPPNSTATTAPSYNSISSIPLHSSIRKSVSPSPIPFGKPSVTNIDELPLFDENASLEESAEIVKLTFEFFVYNFLIFKRKSALLRSTVKVIEAKLDLFNDASRTLEFDSGRPIWRAFNELDVSSWSEKEEHIQKSRRTIKTVCKEYQCATRVFVMSNKKLKHRIITKALQKLVKRQGFRDVYETKRWKYIVRKFGIRSYMVDIPFKRFQNDDA